MVYINPLLRRNLEREARPYGPEVLNLLDNYLQTERDLNTIDNQVVEWEVLELLHSRFVSFSNIVPRDVRKKPRVSELLRHVKEFIAENLFPYSP